MWTTCFLGANEINGRVGKQTKMIRTFDVFKIG